MDKLQKVRAEIKRRIAEVNIDDIEDWRYRLQREHDVELMKSILSFIDSMLKEPIYTDFTKALAECIHQAQGSVVDPMVFAELWKDELIKLSKCEEPVSEDLGEYINELSKQFPEVSFAKLSRIAVRVAKWQKQKDKSKVLTEEQCRKICNDAF